VLRTYIQSIETTGHALNLRLAMSFSKHSVALAISDAVLVLSTALCVPFAKAVSKGYIPYYWVGVCVQHLWQTLSLFLAVRWTFQQ
jgi:sterol O-acyltransferase